MSARAAAGPGGGQVAAGELVGRERELRELVTCLDEAVPVAVLGEAGVGKTTLLRSVIATTDTPAFEGGGLATLSWLPYLPLARALGVSGFPAGDAAHVAATVEHTVGQALLLLDDVHWADDETWQALPLLVGRVRIAVGVRQGDQAEAETTRKLGQLGFRTLVLEPLGPQHTGELARRLRADLPAASVAEIVRLSGGNPLLVEELVAHGEATGSLRLSLAARIRALSATGRKALAVIALAGRPLGPDVIGSGGDELVASGLAVVVAGEVGPRHGLIAETAAGILDEEERRRAHRHLAERIEDPGEAARHHAAAGEPAEAFAKALAAADRASAPGERASHLEVAARCVEGPAATILRLEAARALATAGRYGSVEEVLAGIDTGDPLVHAEAALLRARGAGERDDIPATRMLLDEAAALAAETDTPLEHRIAVERLLLDLNTLDRGDDDVPRAGALLVRAEARGWAQASGLTAYAMARARARQEGWEDDFRRALDAAAAEGELELECRTAELFGSTIVKTSGAGAREPLERGLLQARKGHLLAWERRFATRLLWVDFHGGRFRPVFEGVHALLAQPVDAWERFLLLYLGAQSAADLGRFERAYELLTQLDALAHGNQRLRQALWARADVELWAGRPDEALRAAERAFALFPTEMSAFVRVTHAWALHELGRDVPRPSIEPDDLFLAGVRPELNGVWHRHGERWAEAADAFATASERWHGQHARGVLRCAWASADAWLEAGATDRAVGALLRVEAAAEEHGHQPLLARIRRSLRAAGVARSSPRATDGVLSAREREVIALVGDGLTNAEIGRRLGLTRRTVETTVAAVCRKLGAESRAQAAALANRG